MKKHYYPLLLLLLVQLSACVTVRTKTGEKIRIVGDGSETVLSPDYHYSDTQRIVVLPFVEARGNNTEYDIAARTHFVHTIMELGLYRIANAGDVEQFYKSQGISLNKQLTRDQLLLLKENYDIDLIAYGTKEYGYKPASSSSTCDKETGKSVKKSKGSYYYVKGASMQVVATETGEIVVSSDIDWAHSPTPLSELLANYITAKILLREEGASVKE